MIRKIGASTMSAMGFLLCLIFLPYHPVQAFNLPHCSGWNFDRCYEPVWSPLHPSPLFQSWLAPVWGAAPVPYSAFPVPLQQTRLSVEKRADRLETLPSGTVRYSIVIRNDSSTEAKDIRVHDRFFHNLLRPVDVSGGQIVIDGIRWNIATIPAGATSTISYTARIFPFAAEQDLIESAVSLTGGNVPPITSAVHTLRIVSFAPGTGPVTAAGGR